MVFFMCFLVYVCFAGFFKYTPMVFFFDLFSGVYGACGFFSIYTNGFVLFLFLFLVYMCVVGFFIYTSGS